MSKTVFKSRGYLRLRMFQTQASGPMSSRWELTLLESELAADPACQLGTLSALGFDQSSQYVLERDGVSYVLDLQGLWELWHLHQHCRISLNWPGMATPYYRLAATVMHGFSQGPLKEEGEQYASLLPVIQLTLSADERQFFAHGSPTEAHRRAHDLHSSLVLPWIGAMRLKRLPPTPAPRPTPLKDVE